MSERRKIIKASGLLGMMTLLSRVTGLARDIVLSAKLGATIFSDVFLIAFELPNLFRRVLGEGALSSIVVPRRAQHGEHIDDHQWVMARALADEGRIRLFDDQRALLPQVLDHGPRTTPLDVTRLELVDAVAEALVKPKKRRLLHAAAALETGVGLASRLGQSLRKRR